MQGRYSPVHRPDKKPALKAGRARWARSVLPVVNIPTEARPAVSTPSMGPIPRSSLRLGRNVGACKQVIRNSR